MPDATLDRTFDGTLDGPTETDRARVDTTYGRETDTGGGVTSAALVSRPDIMTRDAKEPSDVKWTGRRVRL